MVRFRLDEADDDIADFGWRVELTCGRAGLVLIRKFLDEVFVSVAKHVGRNVGVVERDGVEVVDGGCDDFWTPRGCSRSG